ncbi:MAG: apolipoprotein N-acyltransferase [Alistipes sp.]
MLRRFAAVILSALLLSTGWLGWTGLPLLFALVPLLWISHSYDASRRSWWRMFGWALLCFATWNALTIWWIWFATPVGPFAATLASSFLNMIAFMLFHTVSKKAPKALAYTLLVAAWIATEYWYTVGEFSWPWLLFGNGFSHEVQLVQWYEYTGIFGGSLWVLLSNILIFEALLQRRTRAWLSAAAMVFIPMVISVILYLTYKEPPTRTIQVTALQPNVDVYDKFHSDSQWQEQNLLSLMAQAPSGVNFILIPETALTEYMDEEGIEHNPQLRPFFELLQTKYPHTMLISGANTERFYTDGNQTATARKSRIGGVWFDFFNSALALNAEGEVNIHHKGRLVIGAEKTPLPWLFQWLDFLVIDLGGTTGQLGVGQQRVDFTANGVTVGAAICYEGLYGDYYGDFVRNGAQAMFIISNDGWWGDTPGYKHLFSISRLRAIEHRRAIARSANTGISGFINARGDVSSTLGWQERGLLTEKVQLNTEQTIYTRYGDYIGRIAEYLMALCILYYIAYRVKKRNHLN